MTTTNTLRIICATTWNDSAFYWNVTRQRWDFANDVIPNEEHAADESDLESAQAMAASEKMIAKSITLTEVEA